MASKLDLSGFEKALKAFKRSIDITQKYLADANQPHDLKETLQAGVIQSFEFCYELSWKMLKRQLEREVFTPESIDAMSFSDLLREGGERQLIGDVKKWLTYRHKRNITSHTYDEDKAESVYRTALDFYVDAALLFEQLSARN